MDSAKVMISAIHTGVNRSKMRRMISPQLSRSMAASRRLVPDGSAPCPSCSGVAGASLAVVSARLEIVRSGRTMTGPVGGDGCSCHADPRVEIDVADIGYELCHQHDDDRDHRHGEQQLDV